MDGQTQLPDEPVLTVRFSRNTPELPEVYVTYTYYDTNFFEADRDGFDGILVNKQKFNELIDSLKAFDEE